MNKIRLKVKVEIRKELNYTLIKNNKNLIIHGKNCTKKIN